MKCSIAMATYNKAEMLDRTLASIRRQLPPFEYEIVVADDGSEDSTAEVCRQHGVCYTHLESDGLRGSCFACNAAYRLARGEVVIAQSDEVIHHSADAIEQLVGQLQHGEFLIATVYNTDARGQKKGPNPEYTSVNRRQPLFFLGSLWRSDLYQAGGKDEDFKLPGAEDMWLGDCLTRGLRLSWRLLENIIGWHQDHSRSQELFGGWKKMAVIYKKKVADAKAGKIPFCASGGPWPPN